MTNARPSQSVIHTVQWHTARFPRQLLTSARTMAKAWIASCGHELRSDEAGFDRRLPSVHSAGSCSSTQRVPSHQRCQVGRRGQAPRRRSGRPTTELADGAPAARRRAAPSRAGRAIPVRFQSWPSGKMAKTWSSSTSHAVAAGGEASVPPRDSGTGQASRPTRDAQTPVRIDPEEVNSAGGPGNR